MLACTMVLTSVAAYNYGSTQEGADANAASEAPPAGFDGMAAEFDEVLDDDDSELGTVDNPFNVLEIVPYKGMGLLGYTVGGEEPINLADIKADMPQLKFASGSNGMLTYSENHTKKSELSDTDDPSQWNLSEITETGYFKKESRKGKGDYTMSFTESDVDKMLSFGFTNGTDVTPVKSDVGDSVSYDNSEYSDYSTDEFLYKNMIFKPKGKTSYTVTEEVVGAQEVIFEAVEGATTKNTYDAYTVKAMTSYYEAKQDEYVDGNALCYEPSYTYDETKGVFKYDPTSENRYYVIFVPNKNGTGKYVVSKIKSGTKSSGTEVVNIPDCYCNMDKAAYIDLTKDAQNYNVSTSYLKDMLYDDDDNLTEITSGNVEVTFKYDKDATGVKKYKPVTGTTVNSYFSELNEDNTDSKKVYVGTYVRTTIPDGSGGRISVYKAADKNQILEDVANDDTAGYKYVLFEEASDGDYVVDNVQQIDPSDDTYVTLMANCYESQFSISKSDTGLYKVNIKSATFSLDDKKGLYTWVEDTMPAGTKTDYLADKVWLKDYTFKYYTQGGFTNNEWFKKKVLNLSDSEAKKYVVKVKTVTADELNANSSLVSSADFIYISDNYDDGSAIDRMYMWENYGVDNSVGNKNYVKLGSSGATSLKNDSDKKNLTFYKNDLDWKTTVKIFKRAAGVKNNYVPIVMDSTLYTETLKGNAGRYSSYVGNSNIIKKVFPVRNVYGGDKKFASKNNLFKLYVMLYTYESPLTFYNKYMADIDNESNYTIYLKNSGDNIAYLRYWYTKDGKTVTKDIDMHRYDSKYLKAVITSDMVENVTSFKFLCRKSLGDWTKLSGNNDLSISAYGSYECNSSSSLKKYESGGIVDGEYKELSDDQAKYWNDITFVPNISFGAGTEGELNNISYDENQIALLSTRNKDKRITEWPTIDVKKNVFSFNASKVNNVFSALNDCLPNDSDAYITEAKSGVLKYKSSLDKEPRPSWIEVLTYIIKHNINDGFIVEINKKEQIDVLEIEPCKVFSLTESEVRSWIPEYSGPVTITSWIATEYNGKKNNVNEDFDLIYMGTNDTKINYDAANNDFESGKPLKNKVYAHLGVLADRGTSNHINWLQYDIAYKKPSGGEGRYKINSNYLRMSGNDISELKLEELKNYADGMYAVVMADDIYNKNSSKIDSSSGIYQFAKYAVGKDNIVKYSALSAVSNSSHYGSVRKQLQKYVGHSKLGLSIAGSDEKIIDSSTSSTVVPTTNLNLDFSYNVIDAYASSSDRYTVTLYVDMDGNGLYTEDEAVAIDGGRKASQYATTAYSIKRKLTDNFAGVLHWALIVNKEGLASDDMATDTVDGFLLIQNPSAPKKNVKVLQINYDNNHMSYCPGCNSAQSNGWLKGSRSTTLHLDPSKNAKVSTLLNNSLVTDYYNITIDEMTTYEYSEKFNPSSGGTEFDKNDESTNWLANNGYNMVIYGFADSISDITNEHGAFDCIMKHIEDGKSLLTSHDTTSMYNQTGNKNYNSWVVESWPYMCGATSNQFVREAAGMNRFAIPTTYTLENVVEERPHDTAYKAGTDRKAVYSMTADGSCVGYTDSIIAWANGGTNKYLMYKAGDNIGSGTTTNRASNVNEGQITMYPYVIPRMLDTASTHPQYLQLNVDDPNMVLWYCLGESSASDNKVFAVSRNDARNYYYLFSYENVFYTGVGHSSGMTDNELKLFINTMIAAFRAGAEPPELKVDNEESRYADGTKDQSILYYYTDLGSDEEDAAYNFGDQKYDVRITPMDYNLISDRLQLRIYDMDDNDITSSTKVYLIGEDGKESTLADKDTDGNVIVRSNYSYIYKFPMKLLQNSSDGVYTIKTKITNAKGKFSIKYITIGKRTLFELR